MYKELVDIELGTWSLQVVNFFGEIVLTISEYNTATFFSVSLGLREPSLFNVLGFYITYKKWLELESTVFALRIPFFNVELRKPLKDYKGNRVRGKSRLVLKDFYGYGVNVDNLNKETDNSNGWELGAVETTVVYENYDRQATVFYLHTPWWSREFYLFL